MVAPKKRKPGTTKREAEKYSKKLKAAEGGDEWVRKAPPSAEAEFQFDSEPNEDSPTPELSGEDDGVSWPSDDAMSVEGGVALPRAAPESSHDRGNAGKKLPAKTKATSEKGTVTDPLKASHAKQKALAQERKAGKANAEMITRSKRIWEQLRVSAMPSLERKRLVEELFDIITGRVKEFVLKHDAGRIIQTSLKYGNAAQRRMVAQELAGEYKQLAAGKYAKYTIGKLMSNGDETIRDIIIPEFYGSVRSLIKHPEGGWILDDIYRGAATPAQKARMLREWYGAEFSVFETTHGLPHTADLKEILRARPEKRGPAMRYLLEMINLLIQKRMTGFTMLHDAMLQYYSNVEPRSEEATEFIQIILGDEEGDLLKNLAFTSSGARLVSLIIAHSGAKERKTILRAYKGHIPTLSFDTHGQQILLTALEVIDDTVLSSKIIYGELVLKADAKTDDQLLEQINHPIARVPILLPFAYKPATVLTNTNKALIAEIEAIRTTTSKKHPTTRTKELRESIAPSLLALIARHPLKLLQSGFGCIFILEVVLAGSGDTDERQLAQDAIVALLEPGRRRQLDATELYQIDSTFNAPAATRLLKALVYSGHFNSSSGKVELCPQPIQFAPKLYDLAFSGSDKEENLLEWATGVRSFVVEAMLRSEAMPAERKNELRRALQSQRERLQKTVNASTETTNGEREVTTPDAKKRARSKSGSGKPEKDSADAAVRIGSKGARAILELLDH